LWNISDTNSHESSEETDVFARHKSAKIMLVCGSDLLRSFSVPDLWAKEHVCILVDVEPL